MASSSSTTALTSTTGSASGSSSITATTTASSSVSNSESATASPPSSNQNAPAFGQSSTLYLYTFLATLVLLLGVSLCIVLRSLVLRRRHRRMVEEAVRNGTFHPGMLNPGLDARDRWRLGGAPQPGDKPQMFDVHLAAQPKAASAWTKITPVSAALTTPVSPPPPLPLPPPVAPPPAPADSRRTLAGFLRRRPREDAPAIPMTSTALHTTASAPPPPSPGLAPGARLGLTVLIAMPSSAAPASLLMHRRVESQDTIDREKGKQKAVPLDEDGEGEIPEVVFGVAQVLVREEVGQANGQLR